MKKCNYGYEDRPSLEGEPEQIDMFGGSIFDGLVYVIFGMIISLIIIGIFK